MDKVLRGRLDMATRVRDFLRAHKVDVVGEGLGLAKLEELVQRADGLVARQRAGIAATRAATLQREGIRDGAACQRNLRSRPGQDISQERSRRAAR